jgi:hypothetical protein
LIGFVSSRCLTGNIPGDLGKIRRQGIEQFFEDWFLALAAMNHPRAG